MCGPAMESWAHGGAEAVQEKDSSLSEEARKQQESETCYAEEAAESDDGEEASARGNADDKRVEESAAGEEVILTENVCDAAEDCVF